MILKNLCSYIFRGLRTFNKSRIRPSISVKDAVDQMNHSMVKAVQEDKPEWYQESKSLEVHLEKKKSKLPKIEDFTMKHPLTSAPTSQDQFQRLTEAVTPLCQIPYRTQLAMKQRTFYSVLKKLRMRLRHVGAPLAITDKLPCPTENIIPSAEVVSYRNKDEFSVHIGVDGNPKTVGYFVGLPTDPLMRCIPPTPLINLKDSHKLLAQHFQAFIRASPHETCLKFNLGGVWRNMIVRSNLKGELMAIIIIYPTMLSSDAKEELKRELDNYFFKGPGAECGLISLYLQACPHSKCSRELAPYELIAGKPYLVEECLGKKFRVSPDSFFQINTKAAEILYTSVRRVAEVSTVTTLLDICCGTGTVSISLAPYCRSVIGIDVTSGAIDDAMVNAQENDVHNTHYFCGKVEELLLPVTKDLEPTADVVAVVNPSRAGLHPSVIKMIRQCYSIKKLVFVCCKPDENTLQNMAMLGCSFQAKHKLWGRKKPDEPKRMPDLYGSPFILRYALPIDLFPHTLHTEYVFLYERYSEPDFL